MCFKCTILLSSILGSYSGLISILFNCLLLGSVAQSLMQSQPFGFYDFFKFLSFAKTNEDELFGVMNE